MPRPGRILLVSLGLSALAGWALLVLVPERAAEEGARSAEPASIRSERRMRGDDAPSDRTGAAPRLHGHDGHDGHAGGALEGRGGTSAVTGLVYDRETRRSLAGVTVTLRGAEETPSAVTDERGIYRLELPPRVPWSARLGFARDGYVGCGLWRVERGASDAGRLEPVGMKPVRFELPGRVLGWQGQPVADARIRIDEAGTWYRSDAKGRFGPVSVGGSQIKWEAWAPGGARAEDYLDLEPVRPSEILLQLVPHGWITGTVVDGAGAPVAYAEVHRTGNWDERRLRTDAEGRFRWPIGFDGGARLIAVSAGAAGMAWGRAGLPLRIVVRPMEEGAWRREFGPRHAPAPAPRAGPKPGPTIPLTVRIADEQGSPLAWASVRWSWPQAGHYLPEWSRRREWTNREGVCRLRIPSEVTLTFEVIHYASEEADLRRTFETGRARTLGIVLPPRSRPSSTEAEPETTEPQLPALRGLVLDASARPRAGVHVQAPPWGTTTTDAWGRWSVSRDPDVGTARMDSPARVRITADAFAPLEAFVSFDGPEVVSRLPERGAIRVRLEGEPEEESAATLYLWPHDDLDHDLLYHQAECVLEDGDGFRIDCPEGVWTLAFQLDPGAYAHFPDVRVRAGEETVVRYAFPRFGRLRIFVRSEDGDPLPDACVSVARTDHAIDRTNQAGLLELEDWDKDSALPAGPVRLRVDAEGYAPVFTRPVDLRGDETLEVTLRRGVQVQGLVRDAAGEPLRAYIAWIAPHGRPIYEMQSDFDGTFYLDGWLPPGPATLRVTSEAFHLFDAAIDVSAGVEEVAVDLRAP